MSNGFSVPTAACCCYINGKLVGRVTSFRWSSDTPRKDIYGLDSVVPYEIAPTTVSCSGSVGLIRTHADGSIEALGMTAHSSQMERERYFTLTLVDRATDTLLFRADYCAVIGQQWEVPERGLVRGTVNFRALQWNNECLVKKQ